MACYNCPFGSPQPQQTQRGINDVKPSFVSGGGRSSSSLTTPKMPTPSKAATSTKRKSLTIKKKK